jgi:PIN domain nuclease of toxin-antitoxin system
MVLLELELLNEIGRIRPRAQDVAVSLSEQLAIRIAADSFPAVVKETLPLAYTRDPFDRLIVAHAALRKQPPVTFDRVLLEHCKLAMH